MGCGKIKGGVEIRMHACMRIRPRDGIWSMSYYFPFLLLLSSTYRAYQDGVLSGDDAVNCFTGLHIIARVAICVLLSALMIPPYMSR